MSARTANRFRSHFEIIRIKPPKIKISTVWQHHTSAATPILFSSGNKTTLKKHLKTQSK